MITHEVADGDRTAISLDAPLDDGKTFTGEYVGFHDGEVEEFMRSLYMRAQKENWMVQMGNRGRVLVSTNKADRFWGVFLETLVAYGLGVIGFRSFRFGFPFVSRFPS